ncbi:MAG: methyltransferase [Kiritimatiellia bacterium]
MLTITLTHHPHARKELFLDRTLRVISRSGLNLTENALVEQLPTIAQTLGSCLFLGGRTSALAQAVWLRGQGEAYQLHTFDAHTARILQRNLDDNQAPKALFHVSAESDLHAFAKASTVFWQMTKGDGTAELQLNMLETLCEDSAPQGRRFFIASDALNETFLKRVKKYCDKVTLKKFGDKKTGEVTVLFATLAHPILRTEQSTHSAEFEISLKGHEPIKLMTLPGCFCHRRADMGGLALTEVVAEQVAFDDGDWIMDMGCGCGMDGLLLATAFPEKKLHVTYQDSNVCARDAVMENLRRYPHAGEVLFSDEGLGEPNRYDLFLANPPYFGDWRIAEFFIETASRVLKRGGMIAFISKREVQPTELLTAAHFEVLNTFSRRGYTVLLARK